VAIHGLNGHWKKSWTNTQDKTFIWLKDLLPTKFPGARILSFDYDARAIGAISPAGVREHADNLIRLLKNEREDLVSPGGHMTDTAPLACCAPGGITRCTDVSIYVLGGQKPPHYFYRTQPRGHHRQTGKTVPPFSSTEDG
jgi:hypothetical protein